MKKMSLSFLMGGAIYALVEVVYKRKTHISMFIAGGIALCLINYICTNHLSKKNLFIKCLTGSAIISTIELITGIIVNDIMSLNVWDYSHLPMNIKGQICPLFSFLWFLITIPALYVSKIINQYCKNNISFSKVQLKKPVSVIEEIEAVEIIPLQEDAS